MAPPLSKIFATLPLLLSLDQGFVLDPFQTRYSEAVSSAIADGLPAFLKKLENLASAPAAGRFQTLSRETIFMLGYLHPGLVPDLGEQVKKMQSSAAGNDESARAARRLQILSSYFEAATRGKSASVVATLSDPVLEGSPYQVLARADAAFRAGNYSKAELLAYGLIESDPNSPLLANPYVILGICAAYRGDSLESARNFQRALLISDLPTVLGRTQDYLASAYRFVRPKPGKIGGLFDTEFAQKVIGVPDLKDPQTLIYYHGRFILADKERILALNSGGAVDDNRAERGIEDIAVAPTNQIYLLKDKSLDPGTGNPISLTATAGGRGRSLRAMRSLAFGPSGALYILDEEAGLLQGRPSPSGSLELTSLHPAKGRLVRVDGRGYIYVLSWDRRSIQIHAPDGKPLGGIGQTGSKDMSIQYFALDALNHVYVLDSSSIEVFAVNDKKREVDRVPVASIPLDGRPQFKNLKVIAVSPAGEVAVTGRNEDNWVIFR